MKSLCIKTNNQNSLSYLLNELDNLELEDICFSKNKFKHYENIIIHYTGKNNEEFLDKISSVLSLLVIDEFDEILFKRLIFQNYFYFDAQEREEILKLCYEIIATNFSTIFNKKYKTIYNCFLEFISENKNIVLDGFLNFRIKSYLNVLDDILNEAVNQFVVEKEYLEFISLLRLYINSQNSNSELVHIIYSNSESILLDKDKNVISNSNIHFKAKYLSDITFSSNDYTLNSLLNLLPKEIYIHLIDCYIDEFINTIQSIFENRVHICTDCNICNLYKSSNKSQSPNRN